MSFPYHCTMCPMKFMTEADLQIHGQVHTENRRHAYDFDSGTEPLFNEFLGAMFPNLNDTYVPGLNDFSVPDSTTINWDDPSKLSASEDDITRTTLTNATRVPYNGSERTEPGPSNISKQKSMIPVEKKPQHPSSVIAKKISPAVTFSHKVRCTEVYPQRSFNKSLVRPVYITRPQTSIAMIQQRYGDDRISRYPQYHSTFLQTAAVAKSAPSIPKVNIENKKADVIAPAESKDVVSMSQLDGVADEVLEKPMVAENSRSRRSTIGEKPYKCEVCFKRFAFIKKFLAHKRIHVVGKLFSCYLCNKRFGYSYKLNQHMRLHSAEKECSLCKKIYKNTAHLRRHRCKAACRKIISKKRSHSCTVCNRTFSRVNYLNLHKRSHAEKRDPQNEIYEQLPKVLPLQIAFE